MTDSSDSSKFARATLRVWSQNQRPEYFASLFGRAADKVGIKGDRKSPEGRSPAIFNAHVYLIYSGISSSEPLESHIEALLDKIEPISGLLKEARKSAEIDIFLGYGAENGQGGAVLSSELLKRLSAIGCEVVIDLFPPSEFAQDS